MAKQLNLNQQLALMPATIPDSIIDFFADFNYSASLENEQTKECFDPTFLTERFDVVKTELDKFRAEGKKIIEIKIEPCGREIPGGFVAAVTAENGQWTIGFLTKLKERTIFRLFFQFPADDTAIKAILRNPPN